MSKVLGLDPGINGAIAFFDGRRMLVYDIPLVKSKGRGNEVNVAGLADLMNMLFSDCTHAFIEQVQSRPQEGRGSAFKFGYAAGVARGIIVGHRIPVTMVPPSVWKPKMGLTKDKDYSRTRACELFPGDVDEFVRKKDNNKAEAALIAYYGYNVLTKDM